MKLGMRVVTSVGLTLIAGACSKPADNTAPIAQADSALLQAVDWYTGVAGGVDYVQARSLLEEAASDSDPLSMMWMARVYSTGRMGFERDEARAREIATGVIEAVEASANAGVSEAMLLMGTAYDEGLAKGQDATQAFAWHLRAAEAGNVLGQHNTGNQYSEGRGVDQDLVAAIHWWTVSANLGDATTQLRLGESYEEGRGVEADLEEAVRWYRMSADSGNAQAREALERLGVTYVGSNAKRLI